MFQTRTLCGAIGATVIFMLIGVDLAAAQGARARTERGYNEQFTSAAKARDRVEEEEPLLGGFALSPSMRVFAGAALVQGYASNPDLSSNAHRGAWFTGGEAGAALVSRGAQSETVALARGTYARFDMEDRPDRYSGLALVDHHLRISNNWKLTAGAFLYRDAIDLDRSDQAAAYVQASRATDNHDLFVRMRTLNRTYLNKVGSSASSGHIFEVDETFSNMRTETSAGLRVGKDRMFAPYVQAGVAYVDFTNQPNEATLDRDAREVWGIAGVGVTLSPKVRFDVGVRSNHRQLDQTSLRRYDATGLDGKLVITPRDDTYIEFNADRTLEEPFSAQALFTDRTAFRGYVSHSFSETVKATLSSGLIKHSQIGTDQAFRETYAEGRLGYLVGPRTELFVLGKTERVRQDGGQHDGEVTTDNRVGAGVRIGY